MIYAVFTAALFCMLAVYSAGQRHNPIIIAFAILVLGNGLIGVSRDILRPYEALSIFGLFFLHFLWKKKPKMARLLSQRLAVVLIFINYVWFLVPFSSEGFDLVSQKNLAGVFQSAELCPFYCFGCATFEHDFSSGCHTIAHCIGLDFRYSCHRHLNFLILMKLKFVLTLRGMTISSMFVLFIVTNLSLSFEKSIEIADDLSIVKS